MPSYDQYCVDCDDLFEIRRSINDESPVICPKCSGTKTKRAFIKVPTVLVRNIDHPDSPLGEIPGHEQKRAQADFAIKKAMRDMGMNP